MLFSPSAYASFTTSEIFCSILISPLYISYTLSITATNTINNAYCKIFDDKYPSSSLHAIFTETANAPIGTIYFIIPNIPPKKSLNAIPIYPDSV